MTRLTSTLVIAGALLTAFVVLPIEYAQTGSVSPITWSYVWMMFAPAVAALGAVAYQRTRGITPGSAVVVVLIGIVMCTYPFWGPSFDAGMQMALDGLDTILAHYLAGALVIVAGLLQLRRTMQVSSLRGATPR